MQFAIKLISKRKTQLTAESAQAIRNFKHVLDDVLHCVSRCHELSGILQPPSLLYFVNYSATAARNVTPLTVTKPADDVEMSVPCARFVAIDDNVLDEKDVEPYDESAAVGVASD